MLDDTLEVLEDETLALEDATLLVDEAELAADVLDDADSVADFVFALVDALDFTDALDADELDEVLDLAAEDVLEARDDAGVPVAPTHELVIV